MSSSFHDCFAFVSAHRLKGQRKPPMLPIIKKRSNARTFPSAVYDGETPDLFPRFLILHQSRQTEKDAKPTAFRVGFASFQ